MIPRREGASGVRGDDVRQILTAAESGVRWAQNVGPVLRFRYLHSRRPIDVDVATLRAKPEVVLVLRATNRTDGVIESGCRISWAWRGRHIRIEAIDVSDTANEYDVEVGVMRGDE